MQAESEEVRRYRIEDAARTLTRAEEIKKDKQLYSAALKEVQKQHQATADVMKMSAKEKIGYGLTMGKGG